MKNSHNFSLQPLSISLALSCECAILTIMIWGWYALGAATPNADAIMFRPVPDAAEHAWVAYAFASGESPLLPIANELHPSRYSPIHPFLASLYLRVHGNQVERLQGYSVCAMLTGIALLYLWLIAGGLPAVWRVLVAALILYSPLCFQLSRSIMQEPSIFLLFAIGVLCWFGALQPRKTLSIICALIAGAGMAALGCIRPTTLIILPIMILHLLWALGARKALRIVLLMSASAAVVFAIDIIYIHHISGLFHLVAYRHWDPLRGPGTFSLLQPFHAPLNLAGRPMWWLHARELLGRSPELSAFGMPCGITLMIGIICGVFVVMKINNEGEIECVSRSHWAVRLLPLAWERPRGEGSLFLSQLTCIALFGLSQIILHTFYFFHDPRFFVLIYPIFIISGIWGWHLICAWMATSAEAGVVISARLLPFALIAILFFSNPIKSFDILRNAGVITDEARIFAANAEIHRKNGVIIRNLNCPVFTGHVPVLNARLLMHLTDYRYPIAPLTNQMDLYWDSHTVQFAAGQVGKPVGCINDAKLWPKNPYESYLYDPKTGTVKEGFARTLMENYRRIALYYPSYLDKEFKPLLADMRKTRSLRDLSVDNRFRLMVVE